MPLVGLTTYLFLGKKYIIKKDVLQYHEKINDKMLASFHEMGLVQQNENNQYFAYLKATFGFGAVTQNEICIFQHSTMSYQSVIADLQKAQSFILINYYIVEEGELFDTIFAILKAKLQANVKVYLIIDHGGSIYKLKTKVLYELKSQGLEYALYFPVNYSVLFGNCPYRNHRKDIIIDGKIGYTGASNISDLYLSFSAHFGY